MGSKEMDDYKRRAEKRAKERTSGKTWKPKEGTNEFRILLTPKGRKSPDAYYEFAVHENVGPEKAYLRCGKDPVTGKGDCLICDKVIPRLRKRGKESRAAELEPKSKLVVTVAEVRGGKPRRPAKLWYPSKKVGDTVVGTIITSKKRDYLSHKKGYNLSITRTGTTMNDTRYGMIEADDEPSKVPQDVLDTLKPFDENPDIPKYDEKKMKKAIGYSSSEDDDDEDDEPKSKKRGRDDDDEDDDDDDDEPKKKKGKKSKKSEDDDDDDDDSDDDDSDSDDDDDDEDGDDDEEDEEEEDDDDEDDDDEDEEDEDEDEDDEPVKKSKKKKRK